MAEWLESLCYTRDDPGSIPRAGEAIDESTDIDNYLNTYKIILEIRREEN